MASDNSLDWLPAGWTMRKISSDYGRKDKCFVEPSTGRKFYSKSKVLHVENAKSDTSPKKATSSVDNAVNKASESLDWLPAGWTVEEKTRHSGHSAGRKFKVYIDPASGCKFYSKPEVSRYLEKINSSSSPKIGTGSANHSLDQSTESGLLLKSDVSQNCQMNKSYSDHKKLHGGEDMMDNGTFERVTDEKFPPGWIKETRIRSGSVKQSDQFYMDPVSGYTFRSKVDALRYLETGDIKSCKSKPFKRDNNDLNLANNNIRHFSMPEVSPDCKTSQTTVSGDRSITKQSANNGLVRKNSSEEIPAGWIMEYRTRNVANRTVKDPYYVDPVSGYEFGSKLDVLGYLETGDIRSCKIKPKKRDDNNLMTDEIISSLDQSTESGLLLKSDVSQNCQMKSNSDHKKLHRGEDLMDNGTFERVTDEKFPPGWIKETRIRSGSVKQSDQFYMDPVSGYTFRSKVDALRYLETGDIKSCKSKPFKRDNNDLNLVNNNIRHGIDHSTRRKNFSKPEVSPDCKTSQTTVSGDRSITKQSANNSLVGKNSSEEIPPGWIMEYRTRNVANRTVKDPYYVDPVSGYEFRSKLDVQRYLETGDIRSCKIKPKKRDANNLTTDENISPSSAAEVKKAATTKRRQISVETRDDTIVSKNIASPEVGRSLRKRKNVSDTTVNLSSPSVDIFKDSPAKASNLKHKGSKKEQTVNLSGANDIIFSVVNDILQEENESGDEHSGEETQSSTKSKKKRVLNSGNEHSRDETQSSTRSKKKTVLNPPLRSSKRLAGNGDKIEDNSLSHTSLNGAACKRPHLQTQAGDEVAAHSSILKDTISRNELSNGSGKTLAGQSVTDNQRGAKATKKHHGIRPQKLFAQNSFASGDMNSDVEKINRKGKGHVEVDLQDQLERQEVEKQNDGRPESKQSPVEFSYLEDPCFEFAFKTLTGAIPVENMSFQDYFKQQANASQNQNSEVEQQDTVLPSFTPNASQSASAATPVPLQQLPQDTTSPMPLQQLPPDTTTSGNISSPNFTHTGHQFGLAAGFQTKAN